MVLQCQRAWPGCSSCPVHCIGVAVTDNCPQGQFSLVIQQQRHASSPATGLCPAHQQAIQMQALESHHSVCRFSLTLFDWGLFAHRHQVLHCTPFQYCAQYTQQQHGRHSVHAVGRICCKNKSRLGRKALLVGSPSTCAYCLLTWCCCFAAVCASGWYGITSFATKQASCNQCPGSRPVSVEGARSASDCKACPEGQSPNEIYSECGECVKGCWVCTAPYWCLYAF